MLNSWEQPERRRHQSTFDVVPFAAKRYLPNEGETFSIAARRHSGAKTKRVTPEMAGMQRRNMLRACHLRGHAKRNRTHCIDSASCTR